MNPLLSNSTLPLFSRIRPEHIEPAIDTLLREARGCVAGLLEKNLTHTWDNLIEPIADSEDRLNKAWSPVSHMNSVVNSEALRSAYNACLPKLSEYSTEMGQNVKLFQAYRSIADSDAFQRLDNAQRRLIENALRDFKLSGVDLDPGKKDRFKAISQELSTLASTFEENVLDATNAWIKHLDDPALLKGLPETALALAKQTAQQRDKTGWLITLEFPSYLAVMTYADNRELRKEVYTAFCTRASDQGPHAGRWDNSDVMSRILALKHEMAQLLGYGNYAELSLATKMAESPKQVLDFLNDLAERSLPQARRDLQELRQFAADEYAVDDLQVWDIGYFSEKMRQQHFQLSQEEVRAYFPIDRVLPGMYKVVERLYGMQITELHDFDSWHPDVRFFAIHDSDGQLRGRFYMDLYARPNKRGGAWMDDCVSRKRSASQLQTPVAYLTCNFNPPSDGIPALLSHDDVITLFHEFGHGLHHMLTQIDYLGVSGISGVEWDAVELPSQFMENWCWEREALELISGHYKTGAKLPDALFEKMLAAKNFQSGMLMVRQLEFSLFDFRIHHEYDPRQGDRIYRILQQVRDQVGVVIPPDFNRFAHSFAHIFAGGYAAGYYSYKWAEVLSSDAFSLFEEKGIFDRETGQIFLTNILEKGGSENAMELFVNFRGREPEIDALLRHNGIGE